MTFFFFFLELLYSWYCICFITEEACYVNTVVLLFITATLYCIKSRVWVNVTWLQVERETILKYLFSLSFPERLHWWSCPQHVPHQSGGAAHGHGVHAVHLHRSRTRRHFRSRDVIRHWQGTWPTVLILHVWVFY